jgi:peptide/nickel transport system permease protein/oligopeptide transport system permease protein
MNEDRSAHGWHESPGRLALRRFWRNRSAVVAAAVLLLLLAGVLGSPWWWHRDPNALTEAQHASPSAMHWLGTDANGRDVLARVCAGARVSLVVGLAGALVSLVIGVLWGAVAGYVGGRTDELMMRAVDILYSLPSVIFIIVVITTMQDPVKAALVGWLGPAGVEGASLVLLVVGLGAISWLTMARMVRAQVISLRNRPFVEASRALGASHARLLVRHILPNTAGVIVVYLTLTVPAVVLTESFLSYLGLGIQPPQASLGSLLADGAAQINPLRTYWWLLAGPGTVLVLLLVALSFVGDGMRDAFDPRALSRP